MGEDAGDTEDARGYVAREATNASRAMARRLPAITVATAGANAGGADAIARLVAFTRELAGRLDAEVGPSLPEPSQRHIIPRPPLTPIVSPVTNDASSPAR